MVLCLTEYYEIKEVKRFHLTVLNLSFDKGWFLLALMSMSNLLTFGHLRLWGFLGGFCTCYEEYEKKSLERSKGAKV